MASTLIVSLKKQKVSYGSKVKILAPAKINLYFNVTGKFPSSSKFHGYHRIESIIERISLCDEIDIEVTKKPRIRISSNKKNLQNSVNLCVKAARLLQKKYSIPFGFNINLKKNIPVGSGLGGGSSDAASTIIAIDALFNLRLSKKKLFELGSRMGSDVNFFLAQTPFAFVWGRGEYVKPFDAKKLTHLIVWPKVSLSTKEVYQNTRVKLTKVLSNVNMLLYALKKGDIALIKQNTFNALEASAFSLCKQLYSVKNYCEHKGIFCRMTGSGSAMYTFLEGSKSASLRKRLARKWFVAEVVTF
ncbi:MAG: 4-(cytidine 5'-diphospho)-2-C-methyl-D-erythritol kinase [Candidatus Omnitrophica bacterium]|nr:4-(cytidine 5'-diphospho)-2-C-methyl-D-erythritol kinase [Candidatus Omnitrophota bacterium]